ncbi:hypothetical protein PROH_20150 [Prochlorothrix hollandica PCC 9006 = CALU 1027]|uniref:Uncharacterized protein n=1 Tax=Prochlorothrix hollandica PCC 9006 = CALU 1027 TaxID=317619 RepID=A0A0M2PP53_PROHO|nr:hypothetical protein PROH_20150 [Prochlorothrix hollandica PCC 9006 = CALU 1027]
MRPRQRSMLRPLPSRPPLLPLPPLPPLPPREPMGICWVFCPKIWPISRQRILNPGHSQRRSQGRFQGRSQRQSQERSQGRSQRGP